MTQRILYKARQGGKTTEAVKYAVENQYEMLVMNQTEKQRLLKTYPELKQDQVFTWDELKSRQGIRHYYGTVIDNADLILDRFMPSKLRMMTITDYSDTKESEAA